MDRIARHSPLARLFERIILEAGLAASAVVLAGITWWVGWLPAVERGTGDLMMRIPSIRPPAEVAVVVALIDDRAVASVAPLPWPRAELARTVDVLADLGAAAIAIDLVLTDSGDPRADAALADSLGRLPHVIATVFDDSGRWLLPLEAFGGATVAAHAYGEVGPDGVVRTFATTKQAGGISVPAFALATARLCEPDIPIDVAREVRPAFRPGPLEIPTFGVAELLEGSVPRTSVSGKIVLLGISATGSSDQFIVPNGPQHTPVPGVLAHASAAASIINHAVLRTLPIGWTLAIGFVLAVAVQRLRSTRAKFDAVRFVAQICILWTGTLVALQAGRVVLPVASLSLVMIVSALLREAVESHIARREAASLLAALLDHLGIPHSEGTRATSRTRLQRLRRLQERVFEEDSHRRALLDGLEEGVVLWNHLGELVFANQASVRLWGPIPDHSDQLLVATGGGSPERSDVIRRGELDVSVRINEIAVGRLAVFRDVTAELRLERQRAEVQRLVSHELKTPLASIAGFGETLERYDLSREEQLGVARLIRGEARRLGELVATYLDLENLDLGIWDHARQPVDLTELLARRVEILTVTATAREQTIESEIEAGCVVSGVAGLIERIIDNLIGNAIKHTPQGSRIHVALKTAAGEVVVEIEDDGPGIPQPDRSRIFDRFYRVQGTEARGSGLGLAFVKEVVDWHGGCIEVGIGSAGGARFSIHLPSADTE